MERLIDKSTLQYQQANKADHEEMRAVVLRSYSTYGDLLLAEHWAAMRNNLGDVEASRALLTSAIPFVCRDGNAIVGVVYLVPGGQVSPFFSVNWAHIRQLGVLPEYRGLGIGEQLVRRCIAHAQLMGEQTLALHTSGYQSAWRIYERLGFIRQKDLGFIHGHTYWLYTRTL